MNIGEKLKDLRMKNNLTQEELADRSELSKGFISQLERDLTSPSIATLIDILECLGTNLRDFFNDVVEEKIVFTQEDVFVKINHELKNEISWIIPNSQKNEIEPIILRMEPGGRSEIHDPHEGEEFGYVLGGRVRIIVGKRVFKAKKGESFYFKPFITHSIENAGSSEASVLWAVTPPTF
jgi:transcriptional regulator with XRE-family HTH domain